MLSYSELWMRGVEHMLFFGPLLSMSLYVLIYLLAAVLPALLLMRYVYRQDSIESEPRALLGNLVWRGVLAALVSSVLERLGKSILNGFVSPENPGYIMLMAFLVIGAVEEGAKFFFLYRRTWREPNFNYRFDAILYAVFVSLGFAAFENVLYVFVYGLSVAFSRAILTIPAHAGFSVFMGLFYGRAKLCDNRGDAPGRRRNLALSYLSPVLLHGLYDTCCMTGTEEAALVFDIVILVIYAAVFRLVRRESGSDAPV